MPRMIELIEASAVPANILQAAAKGALAMPEAETIEILVYLATHSKIFGEQASLTLAGWDEKSSRAVATDLHTSKDVLNYMVAPQNVRPMLLPTLLENLSVTDESLAVLAAAASREVVDIMLASARVTLSQPILAALDVNPNLTGIQAEIVKQKLAPAEVVPEAEPDDVLDAELMAYLAEHAREIADEEGKPFQAIGGIYDDILDSPEALAEAEAAAAAASAAQSKAALGKKSQRSLSAQRGSALQKISKLDVKGRIQLAMKGSKEDRSILVRDGTKVVALAVLESPKITDAEVERIASQKNVLESLLRGVAMKRRFVKHYPIVRNLVSNPRTPLDVSLTLIKSVQVNDLKTLANNKDVSETVRKLALKMYKQKKDPTQR